MNDEHRSFSEFRDPCLSDRELHCLLLYELFRVRADVMCLTARLERAGLVAPDSGATLAVAADRQAQLELALDIRQFETRKTPPAAPSAPPGAGHP